MKSEKKRLLILGAGIHQTPLIKIANKMNLEVHVCSIMGNYPGIPLAQFFHEVDITDSTTVLTLAKKLEIDGILTTATDVCLETIGQVVDELDLTGTGLENSKACLNKSIMKQRFLLNNVPTASHIEVSKIEDAIGFFEAKNSACVLKPTDSSGSRGVTKVEHINDIEKAYSKALKFSKSKTIIIEEWLEGEEFGAQVVVIDNKPSLLIIHSDITTPPPNRIPIGHGCPHPREEKIRMIISEIIDNAIIALGINNTICNVDFILTQDGPKIIEMTCRMGGTHLPEVCSKYWGIDLYKIAVEISLGQRPTLPSTPSGISNAIHNIILNKEGRINKLGEMSKEFDWYFYPNNDEIITLNSNHQAEIGYVHLTGIDPSKILTKVSNAVRLFLNTIEIKENKI